MAEPAIGIQATASPMVAPVSGKPETARSLWDDAWYLLRRNPLFWISSVLIVFVLVMAAVPQLFTSLDPNYGELSLARRPPSDGHPFGYTLQGYDVFARTIYGTRASVLVGLLTTVLTVLIGGVLGLIAGYRGGWVDTLVSRIGEVFFAIPILLAGVLALYVLPLDSVGFTGQVLIVVGVIALFGWPSLARLMRASVLQVKPQDYVNAAKSLGATPRRVIFSHILPNAVAPMIAVATINLGVYIAVEATLAFLGIGLRQPAISWGQDISVASAIGLIRTAPHMLIFPCLFLSITVLAFIMLGDALQDAIDPKRR